MSDIDEFMMKWCGSACANVSALGSATVGVALLSVSCAAGPKQAASGAPNGSAAAAVAAAREDTAPMPEPPGLILVGRARDYRQWLRLEKAAPVVGFLQKKLTEDEAILKDLDLTQPVEFALVFDRSFQRTREKPPAAKTPDLEAEEGGETEELPPEAGAETGMAVPGGSYLSELDHLLPVFSVPLTHYAPQTYEALGFKHWTANAYVRDECLIAPALGSAKARLICADHADVTRQLYGYMTRGLPLAPLSPAPIFVEFRPAPLKEFWEPVRTGTTRGLHTLVGDGGASARAAEELALSMLKEADAWVASAGSVRFEAGPNARDQFEATLKISLRSPEPWLVESSLITASKVNGAPAAFLNLPKNVGSAGYSYGMPADRAAVLQSAVVNLAKTALQEFGPLSQLPGAPKKAKEAQMADRVVSELISALDSPCIRSEQTVWAGLPSDPAEINKHLAQKPAKNAGKAARVPMDVMARAALGHYVIATPSSARCSEFVERWAEILVGMYSLSDEAKRDLSLGIKTRKAVKLPDLPPATIINVTIPKRAAEQLLKKSGSRRYYNLASDSAKNAEPWGPPKGPVTATLLIVPAATGADTDWFAVGLDEKALVSSLQRVLHPTAQQTLATHAEIAPFVAQRPLSLSFQTFESQASLLGLMLGADAAPVLTTLTNLFHGANLVATTQLKKQSNGTEALVTYYVSKEAVSGLRTMLGWDMDHIERVVKELDKASETKTGTENKPEAPAPAP